MFMFLMGAAALLRIAFCLPLKSFWYDEWASIEVALQPWRQVIVLTGADTHPPLFFLLVHAAERLFGSSDPVFRLPSLIAGLAAVPVIYLLARELTDRATARLTLFFVALSPYFIHLSREIRNHGMPVLWISLGTLSYFRMLHGSPRRRWRYLYLFAAPAAVYTNHLAWFWLFTLGAHHAWQLRDRRGRSRELLWAQALTLGLTAPAMGLVWFNTTANREAFAYEGIEQYTALTVIKHMGIVYWHAIAGPKFFMFYNSLLVHFVRRSAFFWMSLVLVSAVMWVFMRELIERVRARDRCSALFWAALTAAPVLVVAAMNPTRLETRYFSYLMPFFWVLVSAGLLRARRSVRMLVCGLYVLVSAGNLWFMWTCPTDPYHREDYIAMSRWTAREARADDLVVVNGSRVFEYYKEALDLNVQAPCLWDINDVNPENTRGVRRIFLLDGLIVSASDFYIIGNKMGALGFKVAGPELRFGGGPDTGLLNLFERRQ